MEKERFKKLFPHLIEEMERGDSKIHIDQFRADKEKAERGGRRWAGHNPDVVGFICRCETSEQAEEIINFLEERGEVDAERASEFRRQLRERGLRSFGELRKPGFYHENR